MLYIESFTFNPFQENTYIIYNDEKQCWIVDPGMNSQEECRVLDNFITEKQLSPQSIINTHTHIDHILGVAYLTDKYKIEFGMHELDKPVLDASLGSAMLFGIELKSIPEPKFYIKEGAKLLLGKDEVEVALAPGHSPGSITFYYPEGNWVISGDVLFAGSIGRTDLPGGDYNTLINSIKTQLYILPDSTTVYSGHGPSTNIGVEKVTNPFVKG